MIRKLHSFFFIRIIIFSFIGDENQVGDEILLFIEGSAKKKEN